MENLGTTVKVRQRVISWRERKEAVVTQGVPARRGIRHFAGHRRRSATGRVLGSARSTIPRRTSTTLPWLRWNGPAQARAHRPSAPRSRRHFRSSGYSARSGSRAVGKEGRSGSSAVRVVAERGRREGRLAAGCRKRQTKATPPLLRWRPEQNPCARGHLQESSRQLPGHTSMIKKEQVG